ncbi:MAG: FtsX-like permease family protein, partial [Clostridium sp.]
SGIGVIGLALINYFTSPLKDYGVIEKLQINPSYLVIGLIFAVVLSLLSALIPIKKIRKLEVKDVILNNVNISMSIGWGKFIVGIILIVISIGINYIDTTWANALSGVFLIISIIGLILIYPKVIDIVTSILYKAFRGKSKVIVFALNNLRTSKVLLGNITLIVISMLAILMITSIGNSMKSMVSDAYVKSGFDVSVGNIQGINGLEGITVTERIIEKLKENENINKDSIQYSIGTIGDLNGEMSIVEGINSEIYRDYNGYLELNDSKYDKMFNDFNKDDNNEVIIGNKLKKKLDLENGDKVTIKVNDIKKEFNVAGSIDEKLYNNGMVIFIKNEVIKREFNIKEGSQITALGNINQEDLKKELLTTLKDFGATVKTKAEFEKENMDMNKSMLSILSIFSYLAIFIAALGVLNNIIIGFLQRKRELAILSSVGMSKGNRNLMLVTESVLSVFWSIIISIPYSYLGLALLNKALITIDMPLNIKLDINAVPIYFVASLILILLATLPIIIKSKKLSIIEELKYE